MRVAYHPEFSKDIHRYSGQYAKISVPLEKRLRAEIEDAISAIKANPGGSGHAVEVERKFIPEVRRRNLRKFPFFILYVLDEHRLLFGAVIPARSDPLTWLSRWS